MPRTPSDEPAALRRGRIGVGQRRESRRQARARHAWRWRAAARRRLRSMLRHRRRARIVRTTGRRQRRARRARHGAGRIHSYGHSARTPRDRQFCSPLPCRLPSVLEVEPDHFRKPVSIFRDHALPCDQRRPTQSGMRTLSPALSPAFGALSWGGIGRSGGRSKPRYRLILGVDTFWLTGQPLEPAERAEGAAKWGASDGSFVCVDAGAAIARGCADCHGFRSAGRAGLCAATCPTQGSSAKVQGTTAACSCSCARSGTRCPASGRGAYAAVHVLAVDEGVREAAGAERQTDLHYVQGWISRVPGNSPCRRPSSSRKGSRGSF